MLRLCLSKTSVHNNVNEASRLPLMHYLRGQLHVTKHTSKTRDSLFAFISRSICFSVLLDVLDPMLSFRKICQRDLSDSAKLAAVHQIFKE